MDDNLFEAVRMDMFADAIDWDYRDGVVVVRVFRYGIKRIWEVSVSYADLMELPPSKRVNFIVDAFRANYKQVGM